MAGKRICSIQDCSKPVKARGWCVAHYRRFLRHGDPLGGGIPNGAARDFVNESIPAHNSDECLIWPFGKTAAGYGVIMRGKTTFVHHIACGHLNGPRPDGHEAAHSCGNPSCVNPSHLRWATPHENALDKREHGTIPRGETHHWARLTDQQAERILKLKGEVGSAELAKEYGVTQGYISALWGGRVRAHQRNAS